MPGGVEVIQLSAALLRNQAPDLVLRLGSIVAARVIERHGARGLITIGNATLAAELPGEVSAGDHLRLLVHDAREDQVTLKLVREDHGSPADRSQAFASVPLPGGANARIVVGEESAAGGRQPAGVSVTYHSPQLGPLRFRLTLNGGLAVTVRATPGVPLDTAKAAADELRSALGGARVEVLPRDEPVDLYA